MSTTLLRQARRIVEDRAAVAAERAELATMREEWDKERHHLEGQLKALEGLLRGKAVELELLKETIRNEQIQRTAAQVGLIEEYERPCIACGKPWHSRVIGYDPRKDNSLREVVAEIVAAKAMA